MAKEKAKYTAIEIAGWFIRKHKMHQDFDGWDELSLLKLLKLLYYAEGCYLATENKSLFDESILAWEHGPVVEEVWRHYPDAYNLPYDSKETIASYEKVSSDKEVAELLENVMLVFGKYSAWGLRNKTHEEKPWIDAYPNRIISRSSMKEYFKANYVS